VNHALFYKFKIHRTNRIITAIEMNNSGKKMCRDLNCNEVLMLDAAAKASDLISAKECICEEHINVAAAAIVPGISSPTIWNLSQ
jgi:hypothetical protein